MKERIVEKFLDIELFSWEDWDVVFDDIYQFYNVDFVFESMKQYNGCDVTLNRNGWMEVYSNKSIRELLENGDGNGILWKGFVYQIPEFIDELNKKVKVNG